MLYQNMCTIHDLKIVLQVQHVCRSGCFIVSCGRGILVKTIFTIYNNQNK